MNIQSSIRPANTPAKPQPPKQGEQIEKPGFWKQVGDGLARDVVDLGVGLLPVFGADANLQESISSGIAGQKLESNVRALGSIANFGGTVALVTGLGVSNSILVNAGLAGLGISGLTNILFNGPY